MILTSYFHATAQRAHLENNSPKVIIHSPAQNSTFRWNSMVPYSIQIVDREDGNSAYDEIAPNKVLVMVKYMADSSQLKKYLPDDAMTYPQPLHWMINSTCFSCHSSKSKLIGPSYDLIAKRYPNSLTSVEALSKKIILGASCVWGDVKMPPHPELTIEQTRQIVSWILKNGADLSKDYFVGTEGAIRISEKPKAGARKGVYVVTASYADHGLKDVPGSGKVGRQSVVIKIYED